MVALAVVMGIIFSFAAPKVYAEDNTDVDMTDVTVTPVTKVVYAGNSHLNQQTIILKINSSHLFTEEDIEEADWRDTKNPLLFNSKKIENNVLELKYRPDTIKTGTKTYSISICGELFSFTIKEKVVKISGSSLSNVIVKGKTRKLSVKGLPKTAKQSDIKWKSSSPSVISVSSKGKIKAKKIGNAIITVSYKGNVIVEYFVNSLSSKMKKVYNYATKLHKNGTYSQSKRMEKNYYDSSSFVWRSYANAGIYIGSKTYAPTYDTIWKTLKKSKNWTVKKSKNYKPQIGDIYENHTMIYDVYACYQGPNNIVYFVKYSMDSEELGWADAPSTQKYARYKAN